MNTKQDEKTLRYIYLGLTRDGNYSVLTADLAPDQIIERNEKGILLSSSFTCRGTNWCGSDNPERTCALEKITPVDHIGLEKPLTFDGIDYDMGHNYDWHVSIVEIMTVEDHKPTK